MSINIQGQHQTRVATKPNGFTLIELMITLSIAAIIATIAVPAMGTMITNNRLTNQTNDLIAYISLARNEAIRRGKTVTLCKANTAGDACLSSANWNDGWILFEDNTGNNQLDTADNDILLRRQTATEPSISFTADDTSNINFLTFDPSGRPTGQIGSFTISHNSKSRTIEISKTGRTSSTSY